MHDITNVFKYILLTFSVVLNEAIEMSIDFSKHMGDLGINYGLTSLENSFGKLREDNILLEESMIQVYAMYQYQL